MKFIDEAVIQVTAGNGGDGCISFRREKYVPMGGPDGGDGGRGGNVIFHTRGGLTTLMDVRYHRHFKAGRGAHGKGKQMTGRAGKDRIILIPVGSVIFDANTNEQLADLDKAGIEWIAAYGGRGGKGNMRFVSATQQAPRKATRGGPGEQKRLRLELKLLADVGLIGLPNSGKSTLISAISNARPKIADYPFTTKVPSLGLVELASRGSFVVADIPGLIEGASQGAGMGVKFLRHIERTKLLVHLIDLADPSHQDAAAAYTSIRKELEAFNPDLVKRPEIVVLTKMDLPEVREASNKARKELKALNAKNIYAVSAPTQEGIKEMLQGIWKELQSEGGNA